MGKKSHLNPEVRAGLAPLMNDRQNETHQDFLFCSSSGIFYQDQGERDGCLLADFDMDPIIPFYDNKND